MANKILRPTRTLKRGKLECKPITIDQPSLAWLTAQAKPAKTYYLLAFADDGLVWGKIENQTVHLSSELFPEISPHWNLTTLQELRLFNVQTEYHVWRTETGWQAYCFQDDAGDDIRYYDESHILWGNRYQTERDGFTRVSDGSLGLNHAVPLAVSKSHFANNNRPLRLTLRHYLKAEAETGLLRVFASRLVTVMEEK